MDSSICIFKFYFTYLSTVCLSLSPLSLIPIPLYLSLTGARTRIRLKTVIRQNHLLRLNSPFLGDAAVIEPNGDNNTSTKASASALMSLVDVP